MGNAFGSKVNDPLKLELLSKEDLERKAAELKIEIDILRIQMRDKLKLSTEILKLQSKNGYYQIEIYQDEKKSITENYIR